MKYEWNKVRVMLGGTELMGVRPVIYYERKRSWSDIVVRINGVELTGLNKKVWIYSHYVNLSHALGANYPLEELVKTDFKYFAGVFAGIEWIDLHDSLERLRMSAEWAKTSADSLHDTLSSMFSEEEKQKESWVVFPLQYIPPPNFSRNPEHTRLRHYAGVVYPNIKKPPHRSIRNNL